MKKNYKLEILYDNGTIETYKTGRVTEDELKDVMTVFYQAFQDGLDAVMQVPNEHEGSTLINIKKVSRVSVLQ